MNSHPDYIFLTGAPTQVEAMAKKFRVYVSKANEETPDGDYLVDHSIVTYFHDDTGDLADCFTQTMRPKGTSRFCASLRGSPRPRLHLAKTCSHNSCGCALDRFLISPDMVEKVVERMTFKPSY